MAPSLTRSTGRRWSAAIILAGSVLLAGCSKEDATAKSSVPAPTTEDALRAAQASQDPLLNVQPKTFSFGPVEQKPYVCGSPDPCQPREGRVSRFIAGETVSRADVAKYFVNNFSLRTWQVEGVYCDPDKDQYVVLASKKSDLAKGYPGRFELLAFDKIEARITIPSFGSETSFNLKPANAAYPPGTCPAALIRAFETARQADGKPVTSVPPGSTPSGSSAP